ncbi:MAG: NYN domain-containing protein [Chloroflexota bacterium]
MIYVIDGHNLIGKMPDIKLSDPDDEQRLVNRLSDWVRLSPRREVRIYFDPGEFGGFNNLLSISRIKVQFARVGKTADSHIIRFIQSIKNPQEYTLVTSDREIIRAARHRRVGYILSEEFTQLLIEELKGDDQEEVAQPKPEAGTEDEVMIDAKEVSDWIDIFKKAPQPVADDHIIEMPLIDRSPSKTLREAKAEPPPKKPKKKELDPQRLKAGETELSEDDMAEWVNLFGESRPDKYQVDEPVVVNDPKKQELEKQQQKRKKKNPKVRKYAEDNLSSDEVDAWLDLFSSGPPKE